MLQGKRAVVTGASRGIGREIALAFARAGATVVLSARTPESLDEAAAAVAQTGAACYSIPCDVTDVAAVGRLYEQAHAALGGVDILVNNAGAAISHKFPGHPDELWHRMIAVNLHSVFYVSRAFVPSMVAQGWGRVITIASMASKVGAKYIAAYTAAKHGALGLTRALAAELATSGVTVNAICPGYVDTAMTDASIANIVRRTGMSAEQARDVLVQTSPQQRLIEPVEVADLAVYLASDSAHGITGQAINLDGGAVMF
jgi:3-hydroxybutyrate dehydrogenase